MISKIVMVIAIVILFVIEIMSCVPAGRTVLYTVNRGDTLRTIAEEYCPDGVYILEFEYEIKKENPWLSNQKYIYEGQQIVIKGAK